MSQTILITHPFIRPYYVYRVYAEDGLLLYIGSSNDVPLRLENHSRQAHWFPLAYRATLEMFPSRESAVDAERKAVKEEKPVGNGTWTHRHRGQHGASVDPILIARGIPEVDPRKAEILRIRADRDKTA